MHARASSSLWRERTKRRREDEANVDRPAVVEHDRIRVAAKSRVRLVYVHLRVHVAVRDRPRRGDAARPAADDPAAAAAYADAAPPPPLPVAGWCVPELPSGPGAAAATPPAAIVLSNAQWHAPNQQQRGPAAAAAKR